MLRAKPSQCASGPRRLLRGMKLYNYFRSLGLVGVRIALEPGRLPYDYGGEPPGANSCCPPTPATLGDALVLALELDDGRLLAQSMAIIEYLDETHPAPALLPGDPIARAHVRALAQLVACEIHPLNTCVCSSTSSASCSWTTPPRMPGTATGHAMCLQAFERQLLLLDAERKATGQPRACAGATSPPGRLLPGAANLQCPAFPMSNCMTWRAPPWRLSRPAWRCRLSSAPQPSALPDHGV